MSKISWCVSKAAEEAHDGDNKAELTVGLVQAVIPSFPCETTSCLSLYAAVTTLNT